jgi:hypothetical protein
MQPWCDSWHPAVQRLAVQQPAVQHRQLNNHPQVRQQYHLLLMQQQQQHLQ